MDSFVVSLEACFSAAEAGGKAVGLARLLRAGFPVPPGICITTAAYRDAARQVGLDITEQWSNIQESPPAQRHEHLTAARALLLHAPLAADWLHELDGRLNTMLPSGATFWAVRSSASNEDAGDASGAGLYKTELGIKTDHILNAVRACWGSLWEEAVLAYFGRTTSGCLAPAMAVIIQPMIRARAAGVAFSRHPAGGRATEMLINAVPGLAAPLVSGQAVPDEYVIGFDSSTSTGNVLERRLSLKTSVMKLSKDGIVVAPPTEAERVDHSLTNEEAVRLALAVRAVEQALGEPVDVEWALDDGQRLWFLQARPISSPDHSMSMASLRCDWSRANFKETLPELPSPLSLSFLVLFMEDFILRHYRELGCHIALDLPVVRVVQGRPFINVTLLQSCVAQLGGRPDLVTEQMGGQGQSAEPLPPRLPFFRLAKSFITMQRRIRQALRRAPEWFTALKQASQAEADRATLELSPQALLRRMEELGNLLRQNDCTFAIVAAVGQAQQALGALLPRWLGTDWRRLFNAALQRQHTIISARQIHWLQQLGEAARHEPRAAAFFDSDPWEPGSYRNRLAGTAWLHELDRFLAEYGHRAIGESDLMSPRFADDPRYILGIVREHVRHPPRETPRQALRRQQQDRSAALASIRRRCGWRYDRWLMFRWWHARLGRALELREANRHHLMYYSAAMRKLMLMLGGRLAADGYLTAPDDVFFLTIEECRRLADPNSPSDWKAIVAKRRAQRLLHARRTVPDFIPGQDHATAADAPEAISPHAWHGLAISAGVAEGPVSVVREAADIGKVREGDIVVMSVLDPGMAALFGLAGGVVAEMGGTLSHGAIIAREFGIPTVANIAHATRVFRDGERVRVDAASGLVQRTGS